MQTEAPRQRVRRLVERLRAADLRWDEAQRERTGAIQSAHAAGLSIRQIATATGWSASRIHQLLHTAAPVKITVRNATAGPARHRLVAAVRQLRQCLRWLHQLEGSQEVVVNLHPHNARKTESVRLDRPHLRRMLECIVAELEKLTRVMSRSVNRPNPNGENYSCSCSALHD